MSDPSNRVTPSVSLAEWEGVTIYITVQFCTERVSHRSGIIANQQAEDRSRIHHLETQTSKDVIEVSKFGITIHHACLDLSRIGVKPVSDAGLGIHYSGKALDTDSQYLSDAVRVSYDDLFVKRDCRCSSSNTLTRNNVN